ncbi:MAG: ribonuclease HI [Spirochaetaceae bacterium]|jgi:ribonuclease HI|nr:ribonuclease HI [Spirochaetaceae bacterium]
MGIKIYTDGSCSGNPGPGGWSFIILRDNRPDTGGNLQFWSSGFTNDEVELIIEKSGAEAETTNNRMELIAAKAALEVLSELDPPPSGTVSAFTDSQYVQKGMSLWMKAWKRNGWRTGELKPLKNRDLWERLDELAAKFVIDWYWIKEYEGNEYNERCDYLTRRAIALLQGGNSEGPGVQRYLPF